MTYNINHHLDNLSPQERVWMCEDYLQRYSRHILNDQEYQQYEWEKTKVQGLGGAFAVSIPFTMIYVFSTKYDMAHYPRLMRNLGILGGVAGGWYYVRQQQKRLHQQWIEKYFSQYSDSDI